MANPALDLITMIDDDGILGLQYKVNLFLGPVRDTPTTIPDSATFINNRAGRLPDRVMGLKSEIRYPMIIIRVRNTDFQEGQSLSYAITNYMMHIKISGYLDFEPLQSGPDFRESDQKNRLHWEMTYLMVHEYQVVLPV